MLQQHKQECSFYTPEELAALDKRRVPRHVAFIPDGNRRWARERDASSARGHREGADILMDIVKAAKSTGVGYVSFYIFSTENWARDPLEVQAILWLIDSYLKEQCPTMVENGIRLQTIGDLSRFPSDIFETIQQTKEATAHCQDVEMILALNYGGRDEIRRAIQAILQAGNIAPEDITEDVIRSYLDTALWPDPDLLIRTSGELCLSNFLLWQTSYTEIYTANVFWPDFTPQHLLEALFNFQRRERRMGGT
jgi:undecaprenyl diphosphate synthase